MKKYNLLIGFFIVFSAQYIKAQMPGKQFYTAEQKEAYGMFMDKNNSWGILTQSADFKDKGETSLYSKTHFVDSLHKPKDAGLIVYYGNSTLVNLNQAKSVEMAMPTINRQNAGNYLYHVVVNDSVEVVHWTKPTVFGANKNIAYAYLGRYDCLGKIIRFEIYELNNYAHKITVIINGGYSKPPQLAGISLYYNNKYLFEPEKQQYIPESKQKHFVDGHGFRVPAVFRWSDSINHIAVSIKGTPLNDLYHVYLERTVDGHTDSVYITNSWVMSYYTANPIARINSSYFNKPGKYEIIVKPEAPAHFNIKHQNSGARIAFTVLPSDVYSLPLKTVEEIIVIILSTCGFIFFQYRLRQQKKLLAEARNRQIATLKLQAVRSQLNPHFIFNALAGIQNLINKNEIENANKYLTRFARLTRNVLDEGDKELTPIVKEIALLNDYLQMEQMRFGFNYNIEVGNLIDQQNTEIPAMLLQPFVENAVKHGVSALKGKGEINISIVKNGTQLILTVKDNGNGFTENQAGGMGIKLCNDRIALLNSIYKNTAILLKINPAESGTTIIIELNNWL